MDWSIVLDVGVGVGALLLGIGTFVAMLAIAKTMARIRVTLDEVDRQLTASGTPISATLEHVNGMADTAQHALARISGVVNSVEGVVGSVAGTATLANAALSPAIINIGATISGISAGLRRLVMGRT